MCRLKMNKLDDAKWDADKSIEYSEDPNVKGYFRRLQVWVGVVRREMEKEGSGEYWDIEKVEEMVEKGKGDYERCREILEGKKVRKRRWRVGMFTCWIFFVLTS